MPEPEIDPTTTPPADSTTAPPAESKAGTNGANDENKFRRLFEAEQAKRTAAESRAAELEALDRTRKEAEMSDLQKAQVRAEEAEARAKTLETENLRRRIAAEKNLAPEDIEFLHGEDEATLVSQAERLSARVVRTPLQAGTVTHPGGRQTPTIDEQVTAAQKAGNWTEAVRLKREAAGYARPNS